MDLLPHLAKVSELRPLERERQVALERRRALRDALETDSRSKASLSWLPRRERWRLARLKAINVSAGSQLVRQGAFADAFFLIERGRARVCRNHKHLADLMPGDFFGEIALLHGGAPTATVVAATDLRVRVIPRTEFGAVLRSLPSLADAVRVIGRERLNAPSSAAV